MTVERVFYVRETDEQMHWAVSEIHVLPNDDLDAEPRGSGWYADDAVEAVMVATPTLIGKTVAVTALVPLPLKDTFIVTLVH